MQEINYLIIKSLQCHTLHSKFKSLCVGDASLLVGDAKPCAANKAVLYFCSCWARGTSCTPTQWRHPCRHTIEQSSMIQKYSK